MAKRASGEGSIYREASSGLWVASSPPVGRTASGRPRRIKARGKTQAAARRRLDRKLAELGPSVAFEAGVDYTVKSWFKAWLDYKATVAGLKPATVESYRDTVRLHVEPELGGRPLRRLRPVELEELLAAKLDAGLSPRTVRLIWSTVHGALRHAVRRGFVSSNIADQVEPPALRTKVPRALEPAELEAVLAAAEERSRYFSLYRLAVTTGARRGELLALSWSDVDLAAGTVRIDKSQDKLGRVRSPKTAAGRRTIPLAAVDVELLERWRDELEAAAAELRDLELWKGSGRVWPSSVGTPTGARNLYRDWRRVLKLAGVEPVSFHALRHTAATLMLRAGLPVHVVAARLGHRDAAITMRIYAHVLADQAQAGALGLDELLAGKVAGPPAGDFSGGVSAEPAGPSSAGEDSEPVN